jgi:hypothetical protein
MCPGIETNVNSHVWFKRDKSLKGGAGDKQVVE